MVYLNRIYTRTGDAGETSLGDGSRVAKTHPRIAAYGTVDELNSILGLVLVVPVDEPLAGRIGNIQHDLFDLGADLCVPEKRQEQSSIAWPTGKPAEPESSIDHIFDAPVAEISSPNDSSLRVTAGQVERLENWIDEATAQLEPLHSFVLPGGSPAAAHLHLARTVCRRAEIAVLALAAVEAINPQAVMYLNRLSDLLFVWARMENSKGKTDVLWIPGKNRTS
ncbi:MAG: cob(I)yrinic acid a,c-diamide adenosyltransferase [Planctomycetaceae bacterium]